MRSHKRTIRHLLPIFIISLILFEMATYLATTPRPHDDHFLQFYVLGTNETAADYYPGNSSYLQIGEAVQWHLVVSNNMGFLQYVAICVKLGNQTTDPPNDTLALPSSAPLVTEFERFIPTNGTWNMPFAWQIMNTTTTADGRVHISTIQINNATYSLQNPATCPSTKSCNFTLIFELWTWNVVNADFQIGWWNGDQHLIAWLQLWFSVVPTGK